MSPMKPLGLLHSFDIPMVIWEEISLNFVIGLSIVRGWSLIVIVVDKVSKYCHLGSLLASYTMTMVSTFFVNQTIRLLGMPKKMVFNQDKVFLRKFWQDLNTKSGSGINMSSAYHSESNVQTEIVNKMIELYLCA